jgi:hypothetical protein
LSELSTRSRMVRSALVAAAALSLAAGTAASAVASPNEAHNTSNIRRACAITHAPGVATCMALIRTDVKQKLEALFHGKNPVGFGYGRPDLVTAYNLPSTTAVRKLAVVDAYNDPNAVSDFNTYRSSWGLAACNTTTHAGCLTVTNQNGKASPLPPNSGSTGWATEESLDVDMAAAICPSCHVFLVEAKSPTIVNLGTAVNSAVKVKGAKFVSNSYGASESSTETSWDTSYYKHAGVAVTASAGDGGYGVSYPAASQFVTSVGGTSLTSTSPRVESVWGSSAGGEGTGSGCSAFEAKPSWQTDSGCSHRTVADVSADADPNTGVAVYDTYDQGGWLEVGGTSVSSPIIASVFALAGVPAAGTFPSSYPYAHTGNLNDVTVGANGTCTPAYLCTAEVGYDGPTGLGTPHGTAAFTG